MAPGLTQQTCESIHCPNTRARLPELVFVVDICSFIFPLIIFIGVISITQVDDLPMVVYLEFYDDVERLLKLEKRRICVKILI